MKQVRMDMATVSSGLSLLGLWALLVWMGVSTGEWRAFWQPRALLWVWGGASLSLLVQFSLREIAGVFGNLASALMGREPAWRDLINEAAHLADIVRRRQRPGLEEAAVTDPLLALGVRWLVDGYDSAALRALWADETQRVEAHFAVGQQLLRSLALAATSLGLLVALAGLIQAFLGIQDPLRAGVGLASALVAVFYGGVLAFLVAQPLAGRLEQALVQERWRRAVTLDALLGIQQGVSPHLLFQRLTARTTGAAVRAEKEA